MLQLMLSADLKPPNSPTPPSAMAEAYGFKDDDLPDDAFPLTYKLIMQH